MTDGAVPIELSTSMSWDKWWAWGMKGLMLMWMTLSTQPVQCG